MLLNILNQRRYGNFVGFAACVALMAYALYAQHVLNLEPCPLCIFQRVAVMAVGAIFLLAALHNPDRRGALAYGVLLDFTALIGASIAARHIWIQNQPPGAVAACGATLEYMLDILPITTVIGRVLTGSGECAEINWQLLGLSMPWWVLFALLALGAWAIGVNVIAPRRGGETRTS